MKEEKKESPIGVLWGWGKPYHGKFIGSVILAVLGVACQMVPYFCVANIVTRLRMLSASSWVCGMLTSHGKMRTSSR